MRAPHSSRRNLAVLLAGLLAMTTTAAALRVPLNFLKPWFYHGSEGPTYTVVETRETYELRDYGAGVWVTSNLGHQSDFPRVVMAFATLIRYFNGQNEQGVVMPRTVPFATNVSNLAVAKEDKHVDISLFLPWDYQGDAKEAPTPQNGLSLSHSRAWRAYVTSFGGFPSNSKFKSNYERLAAAVAADKKEIDGDWALFCTYDPFTRLFNRHNEVLIPAKDPLRYAANGE